MAHLVVSLFLCSSGSNAWGKSRALEGRLVSSKSPSRVREGDEGVARRNKIVVLPSEGSLISTQGKSMIFYIKANGKKLDLVTKPVKRAASKVLVHLYTDRYRISLSTGLPLLPCFWVDKQWYAHHFRHLSDSAQQKVVTFFKCFFCVLQLSNSPVQ